MARGDIAMVKTFLNQAIVRRIWVEEQDGVIICREEEFERWQSQGTQPRGAKIPKAHVFLYDEALFKELMAFDEMLEHNPPEVEALWKSAKPFYD